MENLVLKLKKRLLAVCIFNFAFLISSCGSVPNLETSECTASRAAVKEFYSNHFDGEMKFSAEKLNRLEKFMSPEFVASLKNLQTENDVFTTDSTDYPKAFSIGSCQMVGSATTNVEVLLFWKNDERTEQKKIRVEVVNQNGNRLISKVLR